MTLDELDEAQCWQKLLNTVFLTDLHPSSRHHPINSDSKKVFDVATLFVQFVISSTVLFKMIVRLPCMLYISPRHLTGWITMHCFPN